MDAITLTIEIDRLQQKLDEATRMHHNIKAQVLTNQINRLKESLKAKKKLVIKRRPLLEQLKASKVIFKQPSDNQIYNPISGRWINNTAINRARVMNAIQKHNAKIDEEIERITKKKIVSASQLKMPIQDNDEKVNVNAGKYIVSIKIEYDILNKDENIVKHVLKDVSYDITIKTRKTRYEVAEYVCIHYFSLNNKGDERNITVKDSGTITIHDSGFDNVSYSNLNIEKWRNTSFSSILMTGKNLGYSLLQDTAIINEKVDGLCVPEFIYYECQKQSYNIRLTVLNIKEQLDEIKNHVLNCDWNERLTKENIDLQEKETFLNRDGYDCRMVVQWAIEHKNVSVHCIDPLYKEFLKHIPKDSNRARLTLCFILNNNHCYPIINPEIKKDIFNKHRIDMNKIKFKINDYNGGVYLDVDTMQNITEATKEHKLIYCKTDNLKATVSRVIKETNLIDGCITMNSTAQITAFKHPINNTIFVASHDYKEILDTCNKLNAHFKTHIFEFQNQTWAKLGRDLLNFGWLYPNQSVYSNQYMDILEDYSICPYNTKLYETTTGGFETYDISRCYTKVILDNKEDYPIFYLNDPEPYNGEPIEAGEYYINKMISLGGGTIIQRNGFYPSNFVNYCIENGYITKDDIILKIKARFSVRADYFREFVETIYNIFDYSHSACKNLMNHLLGTFGIVENKYLQGCMTTSFDVACAIKLQEENEHTKVSVINHENQVYFIHKFENHKQTSGHKPIWRHIIAGSIIELDKLYKKVVNPNTVVYGYYTDSIKGVNFNEIKHVGDKYIGCILPEDKKNIYGTFIHDIKPNKPFELVSKQWTTHNETTFEEIVEIVKSGSCMINGCAGSGKTEIIKRIVDENTLTMAFTNKASRDVLKSRGVEAQTIDSYFFKNAGDMPLRKLKKDGINRIVIDEVSMLGLEKFKLLHKIKTWYPNMKINLFGDFNQCPAVDDVVMDLLNENFIKDLCNGVQCVLKYKGTRYDMDTYRQLDKFLVSGIMPDEWQNKRLSNNLLMTNICKTTQIKNNTRNNINEKCYRVFSCVKQKKDINKKSFCVDMPIFARMNNREYEIYNSQKYYIEEFAEEGVKLRERDKIIPYKIFSVVFDYGFCDSVYRYQGDKIETDYNIYDIEMMNRNELYTALSRCTNINNVYFTYTTKCFDVVIPTKNIIKVLDTHTRTKRTGYIYKIEFSNGAKYIGSTTRTIEERLKEHIESPVSKAMREHFSNNTYKINIVETTTHTDDEYLLQREKKHIKTYNYLGDKLLNVNHRQEEEQLIYTPYNAIEVEITKDKYNIIDNKAGMIRIYYDGHGKNKKFKYSKYTSFDDAYARALEFRGNLLRRDAGECVEVEF